VPRVPRLTSLRDSCMKLAELPRSSLAVELKQRLVDYEAKCR
jgi:hypothetical protein